MKRLFRNLARRNDGTVTIELAMLAPMLATLVIGIIDISTVFGRKLEVEQAAHRAIEKVMQTTGTLTVEGTIKKEVMCQINGSDTDCTTGRMTADEAVVNYMLECTSEGGGLTTQESSDSAVFEAFVCAGATDTEARYVSVVVSDSYDPMFPVNFGTGSDGIYQFSAEAGVRVP